MESGRDDHVAKGVMLKYITNYKRNWPWEVAAKSEDIMLLLFSIENSGNYFL